MSHACGNGGIQVPHILLSPGFPFRTTLLVWLGWHTVPPAPYLSAAGLGQDSTIGSALLSGLGVVIFSTMGVEGPKVCCGLTGVCSVSRYSCNTEQVELSLPAVI